MKHLVLAAALLAAAPAVAQDTATTLPANDRAGQAAAACTGLFGVYAAAIGASGGTATPAVAVGWLLCFITVGNHPEIMSPRQ